MFFVFFVFFRTKKKKKIKRVFHIFFFLIVFENRKLFSKIGTKHVLKYRLSLEYLSMYTSL